MPGYPCLLGGVQIRFYVLLQVSIYLDISDIHFIDKNTGSRPLVNLLNAIFDPLLKGVKHKNCDCTPMRSAIV